MIERDARARGFRWIVVLVAGAAFAAPPASPIQIKDCWVRWLPANLPAGGYLTLVNDSDVPASLTGAASADYAEVSIHRTSVQGGSTRMTPVSVITIRAHATLNFADAGYHLMLQQPKKALKPGDHILVTLNFASRASIEAQFELRSANDARGGR
jgi:copper(I)-binding protein